MNLSALEQAKEKRVKTLYARNIVKGQKKCFFILEAFHLHKPCAAVTVKSLTFSIDVFCLSEVQEMEQHMPHTCRVHFDDPNKLHQFTLTISPDLGYWLAGKFVFSIEVLEDYNILVSFSLCTHLFISSVM